MQINQITAIKGPPPPRGAVPASGQARCEGGLQGNSGQALGLKSGSQKKKIINNNHFHFSL